MFFPKTKPADLLWYPHLLDIIKISGIFSFLYYWDAFPVIFYKYMLVEVEGYCIIYNNY